MTNLSRILILLFFSTTALALPSKSCADNLSIATYYPSVSGSYYRVRLMPRPLPDLGNPCTIGSMYVNSQGSLQYCRPNISGAGGIWGPLPVIWTQSGQNIYLTEIATLPDLAVAIGANTSPARLTLAGDGGILAKGTFNSGFLSPNNLPNGSHLIWVPRKAALRAGFVDTNRWDNNNIGNYSIALGINSQANNTAAAVLGGDSNFASALNSFIGGGFANTIGSQITNESASIPGGRLNRAHGRYSSVSGRRNTTDSEAATILGGFNNTIDNRSPDAVIGGGNNNSISANYSVILGGQDNNINGSNAAGAQHRITITGGYDNSATGDYATITGGRENQATGEAATVSGGINNIASGQFSTISGGARNNASGIASTISGGTDNRASGRSSTVSGGTSNSASGDYATVSGGEDNTASGLASLVMGGADNRAAGDYSWAGGRNMRLSASADRTFVWGNSNNSVNINASDAFIIYSGKVGIHDADPAAILEINQTSSITTDPFVVTSSDSAASPGDIFIIKGNGKIGIRRSTIDDNKQLQLGIGGAYLSTSGQWMPGSSRELKQDISTLSSLEAVRTLEQLDPVIFSYKNEPQQKRLGFIAEDVPQLLSRPDHETLSPMDFVAVLTKVAQNHEERIKERALRITELKQEIDDLKRHLADRR